MAKTRMLVDVNVYDLAALLIEGLHVAEPAKEEAYTQRMAEVLQAAFEDEYSELAAEMEREKEHS